MFNLFTMFLLHYRLLLIRYGISRHGFSLLCFPNALSGNNVNYLWISIRLVLFAGLGRSNSFHIPELLSPPGLYAILVVAMDLNIISADPVQHISISCTQTIFFNYFATSAVFYYLYLLRTFILRLPVS